MAPRVSKINLWFKHFTDEGNPTTFLNRKESARAAGYKAKSEEAFRAIGHQNFTKLTDKVNKWLDEAGLSEAALKMKLLSLLEAREIKFQKLKGAVSNEELPVNVSKLATSGVIETSKDGSKEYSSGETLVAIHSDAIETQRRTLDMAMRIKGMFEIDNSQKGPLDIYVTVESDD